MLLHPVGTMSWVLDDFGRPDLVGEVSSKLPNHFLMRNARRLIHVTQIATMVPAPSETFIWDTLYFPNFGSLLHSP